MINNNMYFLVFDIGNTHTVMGIVKENSIEPYKIIRFPTDKETPDISLHAEIYQHLQDFFDSDTFSLSGAIISSVVPEINPFYQKCIKESFSITPIEVSHKSKMSIKLLYNDPSQLGVDRIVNAEGAFNHYPGNSIIIDAGTAITICVVKANGSFEGGVIMPGIATSINALALRASNLPRVSFERPDRLIARDTVNALKSGFYYGWLSMIEGFIYRISAMEKDTFRVILTGGYGKILSETLQGPVNFDAGLTLKGLSYLYRLNKT